MPSVGTLIRKTRIDQGVSLEDISVRTRIALKNLQAIEADDLGQISAPFLYRSFVRQFSAQLNMDYDAMAADVMAACDRMHQPLLPGEGNTPIVRVAPIRPRIRHDFRWLYAAMALVLVVVGGSGAYALWVRSHPSAALAEFPFLAGHLGLGASNLANEMPPSPPVAVRPGGSDAQSNENGIHIRLSAIETTWLSIIADGKQTYSGVLKASQTKTLIGRETARIRTANAGGLTVVFNGKELGPMGHRGETRTVVFTATSYQVVRSAAEALIPAFFAPNHLVARIPLTRIAE